MKVVERRGPKNKRSPKRRERKHSFGSVLFTLLAAVAGCGLLLSYLALFFNPTQHPVPMFFGLYYIPILLLNLLLLLIAQSALLQPRPLRCRRKTGDRDRIGLRHQALSG